jgi:hypothetical protein
MSATTATGQPYARWHARDHPYLQRKRLRLEALLGARCSYCGLSRDDGVNLQFHHHAGRDWTPRKLSWSMRLARYKAEIATGALRYLACDQTGNNCHERCKGAPHEATKLYDYDHDIADANTPF